MNKTQEALGAFDTLIEIAQPDWEGWDKQEQKIRQALQQQAEVEKEVKEMVDKQCKGLLLEIAAWQTIVNTLPQIHKELLNKLMENENE